MAFVFLVQSVTIPEDAKEEMNCACMGNAMSLIIFVQVGKVAQEVTFALVIAATKIAFLTEIVEMAKTAILVFVKLD